MRIEHQRLVGARLRRLDRCEDAVKLRMGVELLVLHRRVAAAHVHGEQLQAALMNVCRRLLVFGNDHDGGLADHHARVLIGRRTDSAGDHQADVDALVHAVGVQCGVETLRQLLPRKADVHRDRLRTLQQAVQVAIEKGEAALVDSKPLPDPVAKHESGIENRDDRLIARLQFAIDVEEDRPVPRIGNVVHRLRHPPSLVGAGALGKPPTRDERAPRADKRT